MKSLVVPMTAFTTHPFPPANIPPTNPVPLVPSLSPGQSLVPAATTHSSAETQVQGLQVQNLSVAYRSLQALDRISFSLQPGQLVGIIGPNGAGKSTLIKAMLGLVPSQQGQVTWAGQPLRQQRQKIAYVPQRSQIDWQYPATVWDVVLMGRVRQTGWLRSFTPNSRHLALASLERVGMADLRHRPIGELSGGQQQRVFLARALAQEADVFCLDEPFVGVDQKTQTILFDIFHQLTDAGKLVMVVNHDLGTAITHFDHLLILNCTLMAAGPRQTVFHADILRQAYQGNVIFFDGEAA